MSDQQSSYDKFRSLGNLEAATRAAQSKGADRMGAKARPPESDSAAEAMGRAVVGRAAAGKPLDNELPR